MINDTDRVIGNYGEIKIFLIFTATFITVLATIINLAPDPGFFLNNFLAEMSSDFSDHYLEINLSGNTPGQKPLLASIHSLTAIPWKKIYLIPLGVLLRYFTYSALVYDITKNKAYAGLGGILIAVSSFPSWGYNSIWVHSIGGAVFPLVLWAYVNKNRIERKYSSLLVILLIIILYMFDYTVHFWMFFFIFSIFIFDYNANNIDRLKATGVIIGLLLVSIGIKQTGYYAISIANYNSIVQPIIEYTPFGETTGTERVNKYKIDNTASGIRASLFYYGISFFLILFLYTKYILNSFRNKSINSDTATLISIVVTGLSSIFAYTLIGQFTQAYIFIITPFLAIWGVSEIDIGNSVIKTTQFKLLIIILLLITGAGPLMMNISGGDVYQTSKADASYAGEWIFQHNNQDISILTGLNTRGQLRHPEEESSVNARYVEFTPDVYSKIINNQAPQQDLLVVDYTTDRIVSRFWTAFEPLSSHQNTVNTNPELDAVYNSGGIVVYSIN